MYFLVFKIQSVAATDVLSLVVEQLVSTYLDVRTNACNID